MEHEALPIKMLRVNGEFFEVELKVSYLRTAADGRLVVMARDVTETKRAATALLERERRINAIMNNVVDSIIAINETGRIESVYDSALGMFGYAEEELIGHNVKMLMTGDDAERHDGYLKGSWKTGAGGVIESQIRNLTGRGKDGATFPMELAVREMKYGVDRGFIGVVRDVTERQAREEALRNSETRLKEIVDNAPMKIALYDANGIFILVNQAFAAFHGGTPDDFQGRTLNDIDEDALTKHKTVLETGKEQEEERAVTAGEETRREHVIRFPIPGPSGAPVGVGAIIVDITDRSRMEEKLRESEKLSALGQLAGGVAHDFNNLLMVIGGYANRARRDPADRERVEGALSEIISAADKAAGLTKQLLTFSRRQVMETTVIRPAALVAELKTLLSPLLGETFNLSFEIADEDACVEADAVQLSQTLINLAINARDAMPRGGDLKISVALSDSSEAIRQKYPEASRGPYVKFVVRDEGTGMDAKTAARVFEPFFTTKKQGKGTGLGLAMVHGFVHKAGGMIDLISVLGEGTTVEIYLPHTDKAPVARKARDEQCDAVDGETILLVEDDDALRQLVQATLEDLGYSVLAAADGLDALEIEDEYEGKIDLVFSDVVMPRMGGFELIHAIRDTRPNIKAILISGYPARGDAETMDAPEGVPLLQKPLDPDTIAHKIHDALHDRLVAE